MHLKFYASIVNFDQLAGEILWASTEQIKWATAKTTGRIKSKSLIRNIITRYSFYNAFNESFFFPVSR